MASRKTDTGAEGKRGRNRGTSNSKGKDRCVERGKGLKGRNHIPDVSSKKEKRGHEKISKKERDTEKVENLLQLRVPDREADGEGHGEGENLVAPHYR